VAAVRQACAHPLFSQGRVDEPTLAQVREYLSPARMADNFLAAYTEVLGTAKSIARFAAE
jgi:hypothetical protein